MAVNPTDPIGDFNNDSERIGEERVAESDIRDAESPEEIGALKADDYQFDRQIEETTPEEAADISRHKSEFIPDEEAGVNSSSVGDGIFESAQEQEAHDARLEREYKAAFHSGLTATESRGDDNANLRRADDPSRTKPETLREAQEERQLENKEDLIEENEEAEDRTLAEEPDSEPLNSD